MAEKNFRVWWNELVPGGETQYISVSSVSEGRKIIDSIAKIINYNTDSGVFPDVPNTSGIEYFDDDLNDWFDVDESLDSETC